MEFVYDRDARTLEPLAQFPDKLKAEIEKRFCETVLNCRLSNVPPAPTYELDQLNAPSIKLAADGENQIRVRIRATILEFIRQGRRTASCVNQAAVGCSA